MRLPVYCVPGELTERLAEWLPEEALARPWPGPEPAGGGAFRSPDEAATGHGVEPETPAVLLVDAPLDVVAWATRVAAERPGLVLVAVGDRPELPGTAAAPLAWLPRDASGAVGRAILGAALAYAELADAHALTRSQSGQLARDLGDLTRIGILLSAERSIDTLLELILTKAREITTSDAGSLYLVETDAAGRRHLRFTLVQNDSLRVPFEASTLAVDSQSLAGHVTLTGRALNLADAYHPPPGVAFHIDRRFDEQAGYRTKSTLVVPMTVPTGEVVGVLQLINRKADRSQRLDAADAVLRCALSFPPEAEERATFLASQAAVALANARLYAELRAALASLEESQRHVVKAERLRALGEMSAGVAHDFNNLLAVIVGRTQLLLRQATDPDITRQLDAIEQAGQDGARTIRRIQEFARTRRSRPFQPVDLSRVVDDVVEATRPRWQEDAGRRGVVYDVRVEGVPGPAVIGDASELRESLLNIFLNALDAMPGGGRVTFTTESRAGWVTCAVADAGSGMAEGIRRRVFEPFFTTKAEQGTGLGLSIAYGIVARHGGEIDVESEPGTGSVFTVRLPVVASTGTRVPVESAGSSARILVVEDRTQVGAVLADLLVAMGHEVVVSPDGGAALTRLESMPFDLVMIDLGLPGLPGGDVVAAARDRRPGVPVVLATGWAHQLDPRELRVAGIDHIVAKPFDGAVLAQVVKAATTRGGSTSS
jgi:signal transduction histidine kinase/ActR/RegA family two-component response regulator